eukprot:7155435-Pyramimonas_sp.AAC.1
MNEAVEGREEIYQVDTGNGEGSNYHRPAAAAVVVVPSSSSSAFPIVDPRRRPSSSSVLVVALFREHLHYAGGRGEPARAARAPAR